ncbi:hypothetical protein ABEF92_007356 [Exophiala dermatitidis]|uniref:Signal recognition particle subunit SRP72 n=1 Tax=Exophiala dermatitidis (strain ATCC 34100 / CBS 525.76 / NIH/UT8656) TaxID=858893 RepID=H6BZV7_EXODN|nr:signal recognition particle, subunit SRP72 [Exophiala dermatitidis NIH/UT8656]EHY56292.1 signal recognition particle, subunit SRP72 [Exophiala dermatitidis NIH/UT8656]
MAVSNTSSSLSAILQKTSLDDHEEILNATNKAIKASKSDLEAQHVKVVALIKLDRFDEAVKFIEEAGDALKKRAELEYAYALYKSGRLGEAVELASKLKDRGARHIEAQTRYRLEDPLRTLDLYKGLRSKNLGPEDLDLLVNQSAVNAQAQWLGVTRPDITRRAERDDLATFETAYNAACGSIARGEFEPAQFLLKRAEELCKQSDELTDQQKAEELVPIRAQQLYVLLCLGKTAEAEDLAAGVKPEDAFDMSTRRIIENNLFLTSPSSNPFVAYRAFHSNTTIPVHDKLFSFQSVPLQSNEFSLDLQTFKFHAVTSATSRTLQQASSTPLSANVLLASFFNAAAHARNGTGKQAIKSILPQLEKRPNDIGLLLTLVQLYVQTGNITSPVELVESFFKRLEESMLETEQDIRFNPILVNLLIGLYKKRGQTGHVKSELAKAAVFWRRRPDPPTSLLTAAGISLLESQTEDDVTAAADIFSKLREQLPNDKATIAGYVASHSAEGESQLAADVEKLTSTSELTRNIDIDALESSGIPQSSNALAIAQLGQSRKRAAPSDGNVKPKRVRKSRLPKDYDENKKPDPERWLPMKDRSYYRAPKGKKKGKRAGDDRTQGGVVNEDLNVESKPSVAPAATGSGAGKKKKGKGKK